MEWIVGGAIFTGAVFIVFFREKIERTCKKAQAQKIPQRDTGIGCRGTPLYPPGERRLWEKGHVLPCSPTAAIPHELIQGMETVIERTGRRA